MHLGGPFWRDIVSERLCRQWPMRALLNHRMLWYAIHAVACLNQHSLIIHSSGINYQMMPWHALLRLQRVHACAADSVAANTLRRQ